MLCLPSSPAYAHIDFAGFRLFVTHKVEIPALCMLTESEINRSAACRYLWQQGSKQGRMILEGDFCMDPDPTMDDGLASLMPPSFEECTAEGTVPSADFVISPLDIGVLLAWAEEHDDYY
jgi:hypothetical protein